MRALTPSSHRSAIAALAAADPDLAAIVGRHGPPAFRSRPPGFRTLVYIILEQQVSLASARATLDKVDALLPAFTPAAWLSLDDDALRSAGVSRQKQRYSRLAAQAIEDGALPLATLALRRDDRVRTLLTAVPGIGPWTADCYLMLALRRPDLWPTGDLALVKAVQAVKGLEDTPGPEALEALGERYRPFRSVATQLFWHYYLNRKAEPVTRP
ncbi:DNA-3-methyladenine glycosylase family protein [Pseudohaliea rubra]|uniref:DNA-3-methyladenine glycosylase II n=1 Tax=Pseudohaliea rubra DSM 19751 TaxID=1265313 RepID=A0A095VV68_9GAMM|nr:DNA-3-methyladenine glycosylase [Pseudohaliea rubra]KGE04943.1 DNA-3-methyladenine glycosylase II [Pseudohaliea rubra DSM 19751]